MSEHGLTPVSGDSLTVDGEYGDDWAVYLLPTNSLKAVRPVEAQVKNSYVVASSTLF